MQAFGKSPELREVISTFLKDSFTGGASFSALSLDMGATSEEFWRQIRLTVREAQHNDSFDGNVTALIRSLEKDREKKQLAQSKVALESLASSWHHQWPKVKALLLKQTVGDETIAGTLSDAINAGDNCFQSFEDLRAKLTQFVSFWEQHGLTDIEPMDTALFRDLEREYAQWDTSLKIALVNLLLSI